MNNWLKGLFGVGVSLLLMPLIVVIAYILAVIEEVRKSVGIPITNITELREMTGNGKYYLANDIVYKKSKDKPIGNFAGIFDGRGHSIIMPRENNKKEK